MFFQDETIFGELTANSMGYLIAEPEGSLIDETLAAGQYWTGDHSILAIRNTFIYGDITYEGNW